MDNGQTRNVYKLKEKLLETKREEPDSKEELLLIWVTAESVMINHFPSIAVYYMVPVCNCVTREFALVLT